MKDMVKGGLWCLLSCLCLSNLAQEQKGFTVLNDPASAEYGKILSPVLPDSISDRLVTTQLTFPEWTSFFSIKTSNIARPVLGDYRLEKQRVAFSPRFLPDSDITYFVSFNFNQLNEILNIPSKREKDSLLFKTVEFHPIETQATKIVNAYPHINVLPENTLRVYVYFSKPMGFGNPYDYISLLDQQGTEIKNAFVELPEGLWNENRTRLTILFHPGRVKQGIGPNLNEGSILNEGELYELAISNEWKDANGLALTNEFSKKFFVAKAQRNKLRKRDWVIRSFCKDECILRLTTGGIPDIELVDNMIEIRNEEGVEIDFDIFPEDNGSFLIRSDALTKETSFNMIINPRMEDICGNNFLHAFEMEGDSRGKEGKPIEIRIVIK